MAGLHGMASACSTPHLGTEATAGLPVLLLVTHTCLAVLTAILESLVRFWILLNTEATVCLAGLMEAASACLAEVWEAACLTALLETEPPACLAEVWEAACLVVALGGAFEAESPDLWVDGPLV